MPWAEDIKKGIFEIFDKEDKKSVFYIENMDTKRYSGELYYQTLARLYETKYKETKFDLILSSDNNALEFLKEYRNSIFGNVPVVFSGVNNYDELLLKGHKNYTGVSEDISYEENIELILKLHPEVKNIYFINDYLYTGRIIAKNMHTIENKYHEKVNIIHNKNISLNELKSKVSSLNKDTVVLMGTYFSDKNKDYITYEKVGEYILGTSSVPVYCIAELNVGKNVIGGHVVSSYKQGMLMATLGKKILTGRKADDLNVIQEATNKYIFNSKSLQKFKINRDELPQNSQIVNDNITYYDQFEDIFNIKYLIVFVCAVIILIFIYQKIIFNEKGILKLLVYGPIVFLPLVIGTLIYNLVQYNDKVYKNDIQHLQVDYLQKQQKKSYEEIEKTIKFVNELKAKMSVSLKTNLKNRVDEAYIIADNIYTENKNTKSKEEIQKMIVDALSQIRFFDGRGYYFINTNNGRGILFKGVSKLTTNTDLYNLQDKNGDYIIRKQIDIVRKNKAGYMHHFIEKIDEIEASHKLTYVRNFEPYDWHIGTGEYLDDFNQIIKNEIYEFISTTRYDNNGYLFALTPQGIVLAHGDYAELVGQDMSQKVDSHGVSYTKDIISNAMLNNLKFTKFGWLNSETHKIDTKYVIATYIHDYDMVIGTGVYDNDVKKIIIKETLKLNRKNNEQIEQILIISVIVLFIVLVLSFILSSMVKKIFQDYNQKLNDLNISLEHRIEDEIKASKEKDNLIYQQSKMASMGEMIGNIAHQWRQPLSVISVGATGLKMQKEHSVLSDSFFYATCDAINNNAQYLSKTIDDFKNFIKNDRDKVQFNLKENIDSFLSLVNSSIKNNQINIILDLEKELMINSYPNELTQCFMNLFNNSKDAFSANMVDKYLFISSKVEYGQIVISFKDNAGGIDENVIDNIFEPYFTTKHKSQGTGLGLSMTYKIIVEGMDGTIDINNCEYKYKNQNFKGAEFIIKFDL